MAEKISITKGLTSPPSFDTYVPELSDNADIQNAFELFYYGNSEDGNTIDGTNSIYSNLVDFNNRINSSTSGLSGHTGAISDVHGVGSGSEVVGTIKTQTLTNKTINLTNNTLTGTTAQFNTALSDDNFATQAGTETLTNKTFTSPKINENVVLSATSTELNVLDGITASTTELNYVDGVTSAIQTQIDTNTPVGMISIHAGSSAPTGWLLCDGASYASASYTALFSVIGYTFGGSGSSFFVPNLKGRVVVGTDASQTEFDSRGEIGGAMTHQHAASNSGNTSIAHNHSINPPSTSTNTAAPNTGNADVNHDHTLNIGEETTNASSTNLGFVALSGTGYNFARNTHTHNYNPPTTTTSANGAAHYHGTNNHDHTVDIAAFNTAGGEGGSHTHTTPASDSLSNLQPYMALNYIIKH